MKEQAQDARGSVRFECFWHDLRHALRQLRRSPVSASVGLITVQLGIGEKAAMFSAVQGVIIAPL
jgi:hypothetical protein